MQTLNDLMTAAMQLAGTDDQISHNARLWQMEGGRACQLGWGGCSQAVYVDLKTGEHDYGEPGGPGHADCVRNCRHGMNPPPDDTEYLDCEWTPETQDACPFCAGTLCNKCGAGGTGFTGHCEHDSLERHEIVRKTVPNYNSFNSDLWSKHSGLYREPTFTSPPKPMKP